MSAGKTLADKRVVIVSRFRANVPVMNLAEFLRPRARELILIRHPFFFNREIGSSLVRWDNGVAVKEQYAQYPSTIGEAVLYIRSFLRTIFWLMKGPHADIFVGLGTLDAFSGIVLRWLGKVDRVVFYSIDFVPDRFPHSWLGRLYNAMDRAVVVCADAVWNLSPVMVEMREKFRGVPLRHRRKQIVVPIGTNAAARQCRFEEIHRFELCYVGHLREGQGVDFLISLMPRIRAVVPEATLVIVGGGAMEAELRRLADDCGVADAIRFAGFMSSEQMVEEIVAHAAVAVAPYTDDGENFTRFTDPGKIKTYLAAGVPVVMTDIVPIARTIEEQGCGFAVPCRAEAFIEKITALLKDAEFLRVARERAERLSKEFHWDTIFERSFQQSFSPL
jgi:glycosyltransferase involved in cell wall biosynthesis